MINIETEMEELLKNIQAKVNKPIIFFDCETTGLDTSTDDIIQIYAAKIDGQQFDELHLNFNTDVSITEEALSKHNISKESLKDSPYLKDCFDEVFDFFYPAFMHNDEYVICGANHIRFDIPILINNLLRYSKNPSNNSLISSFHKNPTIDILAEHRRLYPNNLSAVFQRIVGEDLENAHDAKADVYATGKILEKFLTYDDYEIEIVKSNKLDISGFFIKCDETGKLKFAKGKYANKTLSSIPQNSLLDYLRWIASDRNTMDNDTKLVASKIIDMMLKRFKMKS